ncbi:MAG: hypothetical protein DLM50_07285 [Candidatus Meridianibacter frigidus]|nr:MAG: hypothetical protein DLM50_07285 [Candidatus Eremiobacteraeota bacterium]
MSWLGRIEEACASFIERSFARVFPADLEPAHIARKLIATMEAKTSHEGDRAIAPGRYIVRVNAGDLTRLSAHREYLEREWAHLLQDVAARVSIEFENPLQVELVQAPAIVSGAVEIATEEIGVPGRALGLRVIKGVPQDGFFALTGPVTIGRSRQSDIVLADPRISRQHARVELQPAGPVLRDLGSTNGTFVDGRRLNGTLQLHSGMVVGIGNTMLRLENVPA